MRFVGIAALATAILSATAASAQSSLSSDYRHLTCAQLEQEGRATSKRGFVLSGLDAGMGGVAGTRTAPAIIIVWPSIEGKHSESLALAIKQIDAIEQASVASQCSIRFQRPHDG
jgi:hypothetical protein